MKLPPPVEYNEKIVATVCTTPRLWHMGPYVTTNGCTAPIYVDMRTPFSDPKRIRIIATEMVRFLRRKKIKVDMIVGGATAGIPLSTAMSLVSGIPAGYVRKEHKGGGLNRLIEGNWVPGMRCLLVEDALGHGAAKEIFIKNIRAEELRIDWVMVMLSRSNRRAHYFEWMKHARVHFQSFGDIEDIVVYSTAHKLISPDCATLMRWYEEDAHHWNENKEKWQFFLDYKRRWKRGAYKKYTHNV